MPFPDGRRTRPALADADLRRALVADASRTRCTGATSRKGQTGLSVAFDLPTQTGYDPDAELARGEVGKVGVPVSHIGDVRDAVRRHPAGADEHVDDDQRAGDVPARALPGGRRGARRRLRRSCPAPRRTTSSRSTCRAARTCSRPAPSLRLITDMIAYTVANVPKWNPINVCSYHLQEAGATPVQEVAFALCTAIAVLDSVRDSGQVAGGQVRRGRRADLVLRQRRRALRRGDVQAARLRPSCGTRSPSSATASQDAEAAPVPLRRAGQLARAHRGAAGEQRLPHPARDARRDDVEGRPRPRGAAAGLERGARPAAAVGPAVVAAHAAGAGLRVRPARVRGPVRGLDRRRGEGRPRSRPARAPRSTGSSRWAARSPRSSPAT